MVYPVRFLPFKDELLTSWFVRLAWANGRSVQRLSYELVPRRSSLLLNVDLDFAGNDDWFESIGRNFQINRLDLEKYSLVNDLARSMNQVGANGQVGRRWLVSHKKHRTGGPQSGISICPQCLAEDEVPYFRRHWRFSWYTVCEKHKVNLIDQCPNCSAYFDFKSYDHGREKVASLFLGNIAKCHFCGVDLARREREASIKIAYWVSRLQADLERAVSNGFLAVGSEPVYSFAYFDTLRHLLQISQGARGLHDLLNHVSTRWKCVPRSIEKARDFDGMNIESRRTILTVVGALLSHFPEYLVILARTYGVSGSWFQTYNRTLPFFFSCPISQYLDRSWYQPSTEEIVAVRQFLEKQKYPCHFFNVRRWLGRFYPDTVLMRDAKNIDRCDF